MSLSCRSVTIATLYVNTVSSSGIVHLGDGEGTDMDSKALAVQQAITNYTEDEFYLESYPLFYLPKLTLKPCSPVRFSSVSPWPTLRVGALYSLGVSSSSILRAGCSGPVQGESRIKHFRYFNQLNPR
ncbi:spore germination protein GerPE [Cohnella boryungensis]|uniref:Spore germination protein GerPE n=1 Tax=Cohnella boryungensis TaxID=768479 RepID=A0ABV8S554_9BACL